MSEDYRQSGVVNRLARAAVQLQMYLEETARSLGVHDITCTWDVEGGWERLPDKAALSARGGGDPVTLEFSREEIAGFPSEADQGRLARRLRDAAHQLAEKGKK